MGNMVKKPTHYTATKLEPITVIEEWNLPFHLGAVVKYIGRHTLKHSDPNLQIQDLEKAQEYLRMYIELLRKRSKGNKVL